MPIINLVYGGETAQPITAGIYHNSTLGLISLSSDGSTWITIADKNLGATQVYNSGDTLSEANCGKYYQWGNNYGFPFTGSVTTSSSQVNAGSYGPGNYYSSSTFIYRSSAPLYWESSLNDNLWGDVTDTNEARKGPCSTGYHIPSLTEMQNFYNAFYALGITTPLNFSNYLKVPFSGMRRGDTGDIFIQSYVGGFWTSTPGVVSPSLAAGSKYSIYFNSGGSFTMPYPIYDTYGYSVRPFKNDAVKPDSSRTKLY